MFDISRNGIITMARGDTWTTQIFVNLGTELVPYGYELQEGEYLYFGVMEPNRPFEVALIRKRYDMTDATPDAIKGTYDVRFESKDTVALLPGTYYYEVKLKRLIKNGDLIVGEEIDTIIPRTKFVIYE